VYTGIKILILEERNSENYREKAQNLCLEDTYTLEINNIFRVMIHRKLLVVSAILILIWVVGVFVFHTTLEGYLHMFLLLATNTALFCLVKADKAKVSSRQLNDQ